MKIEYIQHSFHSLFFWIFVAFLTVFSTTLVQTHRVCPLDVRLLVRFYHSMSSSFSPPSCSFLYYAVHTHTRDHKPNECEPDRIHSSILPFTVFTLFLLFSLCVVCRLVNFVTNKSHYASDSFTVDYYSICGDNCFISFAVFVVNVVFY